MKRETKERLSENILIPEQFRKKYAACRGTCIKIGPEVEYLKVGEDYVWGQYAGSWITADGYPTTEERDAQFFVLNEEDVIAGVE